MIGDDDLAAGVFFDVADFAVLMTRTRSGVADVSFAGNLGEQDEDALEGRVVAAERVLAYAAGPDVQAGDLLACTWRGAACLFRARQPRLVLDGSEARVMLTKVTP